MCCKQQKFPSEVSDAPPEKIAFLMQLHFEHWAQMEMTTNGTRSHFFSFRGQKMETKDKYSARMIWINLKQFTYFWIFQFKATVNNFVSCQFFFTGASEKKFYWGFMLWNPYLHW